MNAIPLIACTECYLWASGPGPGGARMANKGPQSIALWLCMGNLSGCRQRIRDVLGTQVFIRLPYTA